MATFTESTYVHVIGASLSGPYTRELVVDFEQYVRMYVCMYVSYVLVLGLNSIYLDTSFKITFMMCFIESTIAKVSLWWE